jgi:hypothetical protein
MTRTKSPNPKRRMGVYKRFDSVPTKHRLDRYNVEYEGQDVWAEFERTRNDEFDSEAYRNTLKKTERTWKAHMSNRGRHHALARPRDVETWCADLATDRKLETVYKEYWIRLEEFYSWLQTHIDHPHVYQPVLMAAASHEIARAVWWVKMDHNKAALGGVNDD